MTQHHAPEDWKARALEAEERAAQAEVLLARLQAAVEKDALVPYNFGLTAERDEALARAESAEAQLQRIREWAEAVKDRPFTEQDFDHGVRSAGNYVLHKLLSNPVSEGER